MQGLLEQYYKICDNIAFEFGKKYYDLQDPRQLEDHRVVRNQSDVWEFGDQYWDLDNIIVALDLDAPFDLLDSWYWGQLLAHQYEIQGYPNLKNYLQFPKARVEAKEIQDIAEKVEGLCRKQYDRNLF